MALLLTQNVSCEESLKPETTILVDSGSLLIKKTIINKKSPLRLHTQLVTPNHWLVTQRMNMR